MTTQASILKLLLSGHYASQIAKELHISPSAVSQGIRRLVKKGLIKEEIYSTIKTYTSTSKVEALKPILTARIGSQPASSQAPSLRLHRLERKHLIIGRQASLSIPNSIDSIRHLKLNNNEQEILEVEGITARLTTKNVIVEGIQLLGELGYPAPDLLREAEAKADKLALKIARLRGLRIEAKGTTSIYEIEITPFEPAKQVKQKGIITLYKDRLGRMVWMDKSLNLDAIESNYAPYLERLRELTQDIVKENAWQEQKEAIRALSQLSLEQGRNLNELIKVLKVKL